MRNFPSILWNILFYSIKMSVLLENRPLVKFIQNYIWDLSGIFYISSLVKISMISLISSLSLNFKLYLNPLVYDQIIFGSFLKVFSNFRKSLEIFRKFGECLSGFWDDFRKPSEISRKWLEILGKLSKMPSSVCLKKPLNISSKI